MLRGGALSRACAAASGQLPSKGDEVREGGAAAGPGHRRKASPARQCLWLLQPEGQALVSPRRSSRDPRGLTLDVPLQNGEIACPLGTVWGGESRGVPVSICGCVTRQPQMWPLQVTVDTGPGSGTGLAGWSCLEVPQEGAVERRRGLPPSEGPTGTWGGKTRFLVVPSWQVGAGS